MRVVRVYHAGRTPAARARDRALAAAGAEVTLVVPSAWPDAEDTVPTHDGGVRVVELEIRRPGDINRHSYRDIERAADILGSVGPDILDIHEEPFSLAARQWLAAAPAALPVALYTAQNIDKRFPPPFARYERQALRRADGMYPCSRQAASVARGKGFAGVIEVLPLGYDAVTYRAGAQQADGDLVLVIAGRLVPEKGVVDAVRILARLRVDREARLVIAGDGPARSDARRLSEHLHVREHVDFCSWQGERELAELYRAAHVVIVPSHATPTWTEQFGRVIVEAQACGAVVAAYATGAIPEVTGGAAILSGDGDADALADGIASLFREEASWRSLRDAGLALAATRTWDEVAERHLELYRRVLAADRPATANAPRGRRQARREFGATADTPAGRRPFALPLLRQSRIAASTVERLLRR
jgi:glycosyltransferase involved in cell wall biosynthesis